MKHLFFFACFCICLSSLSLSQAAPQTDKVPEPPDVAKSHQIIHPNYAPMKVNMRTKKCDILLVGDSITEQWEFVGKKVWDEFLAPKNAIDFGISGDRTENVLWRMEDTKLETTTEPKVCTLLIGTNNIQYWNGKQSADDTVKGLKKVATTLLNKFPKTHLIIFTTFPFGPEPNSPLRKLGDEIGKKTLKLKLPRTTIVNINKHFLNPDGTFKPGVFKDDLHLTEQGYRIWAAQLMPLINKYLPNQASGK